MRQKPQLANLCEQYEMGHIRPPPSSTVKELDHPFGIDRKHRRACTLEPPVE